jgi:hypothetical protein
MKTELAIKLLRTLDRLKIVHIAGERSYNGNSRSTFRESEEEGYTYVGDQHKDDADAKYPAHRWVYFVEKKK